MTPTTTDAQAGTQVLFVSVPFEELDTGGAGVAVVVAPAALVKDVCAAAVADDAYFGVLNVPVHHHLLQQAAAVVLLHGMQQQCRSCSVHQCVTGQRTGLDWIVALLFRVHQRVQISSFTLGPPRPQRCVRLQQQHLGMQPQSKFRVATRALNERIG